MADGLALDYRDYIRNWNKLFSDFKANVRKYWIIWNNIQKLYICMVWKTCDISRSFRQHRGFVCLYKQFDFGLSVAPTLLSEQDCRVENYVLYWNRISHKKCFTKSVIV